MATIIFQRSGGVLGQEIDLFLALESLPASEVQSLFRLIEETAFFKIPENIGGQTGADEFKYTISLETGSTQHTIHTTDSTMPESLRPLIEELTLLSASGEAQPGK